MKKNDSITNLHRQGVDDAATEDMQNVHDSIHREERESHAGRGMLRLWFLGVCGLALIIGGAFLVRSRDVRQQYDGGSPSNAVAPAVANPLPSAVTQVSMRNLQFYPVTLQVKKGDVIEWKNDDLVPHTATSASFNSGTIVSGQSWRHTFTDAGSFPYVCTFHPQMKGVVIVK
jgi:plastocyanin